MLLRAFSAIIALSLIACSVGKPKQAHEVDQTPVRSDPTDDPDPVDAPDPDPKPVADPLSSSSGSSDPENDDYEISYQDCRALGSAYGRAWLGDERTKLDAKKLKQAQYDKVYEQLRDDSKGMAQQYQGECDKTVPSAYLRSRLKCALKAKRMQRFNDCMDGKSD
jgi:hypothetical protein